MRNSFWDKRIPTLFGLLFLVFGVFVSTILVKNGATLISKASPAETPKNVRITNISDASFTVSYVTDVPVIGSVNFGIDKNFGQSFLDDRDREGKVAEHKVHYMTIRNLKSKTTYFFEINSGQNTFLNNDVPFEITTGQQMLEEPPIQNSLTGTAILPDGNKPDEAIVYTTLENAQNISTLVKKDGTFTLPLNFLRTANLSSYFAFSNNTVVNILATDGDLESKVSLSLTSGVIPPITLSSDYDFTLTTAPIASESAKSISFPLYTATEVAKNKSPEISTPKKDQEFSDQKPQFKGKALPNQKVLITIHSEENIQTQVTSDANGNWTYRSPTPLSPGSHAISIKTLDRTGIFKTLTQSFTVFAQGSQVLPAVPSGTQNQTPTPTATIAPTPIANVTPISSISPTLIPTEIPTPTNTPTPTLFVPIPTIPPTGGSIVPISITAVIIMIAGIAVFFLTHVIPL